ncbi:MAG: Undecaprenyl-phosphate alpha-N-acetylglucosaminyl 1-phosphate transferase [Cytophagales bacterium]|nr:undecaprenyl/decaprenyl-phosphate alpha-N-acetylglucosaminyl 1-phosphate transferase [Bacteroidota bacterium]MBS1979750.1 undecaprenyl/decaprenyl-phosphate alpha-N-acetylglucosaminyl 1-phosphate transferase [Bacteroidota bacterium]WHZ07005.1 MAG: Undecaprenyl-phosphate alpha-N-acetylglucosaminyl 1-phosphate transferase [Cytophagales bacterium]
MLYTAISFLISFLTLPVLIKLLTQWKLLDSPGKHKIHSQFKPSLGGVAVLLGVGFSLLLALPLSEWLTQKYFFISLLLMFLIGLRDDVLALTPRQKLVSQFLPVILLVVLNQTTINSSYGLFDLPAIPTPLIWLLSIFTLIILTNAYNLIDGLDGLAGTIGIVSLTAFGVWFYLVGNFSTSLIALTFAGALLAFLFFNWQPSKIFMGDTGALTIGFLISYLAITFVNVNYRLPESSDYKMKASIASSVCVAIIPVFDTLRVIILRLRQGLSPFHADKNHLHHQFLKLGFSHAVSVLFMASINLIMILLAWLLRKQNDLLILPIVIAICLIINFVLKKAQQAKSITHGAADQNH